MLYTRHSKCRYNIIMMFEGLQRGLQFRAFLQAPFTVTCGSWNESVRPWRNSTAYISESIIYIDVKFWHAPDSSFKIVLPKFRIVILHGTETMRYSALQIFREFSAVFFIMTFDWNGNSKIWWFHREDLVQIYQCSPYFKLRNVF